MDSQKPVAIYSQDDSVINDLSLSRRCNISEVIATMALKYSDGFTRLVPSIIVLICYSCAFFFYPLFCVSCRLA